MRDSPGKYIEAMVAFAVIALESAVAAASPMSDGAGKPAAAAPLHKALPHRTPRSYRSRTSQFY
jgi:hypothetical protein